jgi:hypothetical protein
MAMSNQPKGISIYRKYKSLFGRCCTIERCSIKRYQFIRKFYTHSTSYKVKLTFNESRRSGNYGIYKMCKTLVLTTTELKVTSVRSTNALSKYKMIDSITNVFDTLQTNRLDNQIWKWFVIFALLFW